VLVLSRKYSGRDLINLGQGFMVAGLRIGPAGASLKDGNNPG
jgi:hypothetical protein